MIPNFLDYQYLRSPSSSSLFILEMEMKSELSAVPEDSKEEKWNTLKVIGVGLCRTDTSSLRDALTFLCFPCYHFSEMTKNKQEDLWVEIPQGKPVNWQQVFEGYTATVDFRAVKLYRALMEEYPEAKIILMVRDSERWYASTKETVYRIYNEMIDMHSPARKLKVAELANWEGTFHGRFEDKEYAISIYEQHNQEVKRLVPAEKLLVFDAKDGWDPLCKFLGVPVPEKEVPFPRSYDKSDFWTRIEAKSDGNSSTIN